MSTTPGTERDEYPPLSPELRAATEELYRFVVRHDGHKGPLSMPNQFMRGWSDAARVIVNAYLDAIQDYCGCCGDEIPATGNDHVPDDDVPMWCNRCWHHTGVAGPLWERTYEALNGEPCPFQIGATPKEQTQ